MVNSRTLPAADIPDEGELALGTKPNGNRNIWLFGGGVLLLAILLFIALEARRNAAVSPSGKSTSDSGLMISAPPDLAMPAYTPDAFDYGTILPDAQQPVRQNAVMLQPLGRAPQFVQPRSTPIIPLYKGPTEIEPSAPVQTSVAIPQPASPPTLTTVATTAPGAVLAGNRVGPTRFANPSATVPQGAVIQAVLETALDSNRPGFVRAIVSRDVRSFDGSQVLIQRGSRLLGEYKAELARGQNRAFIQWQTLTRPDGVQIAVNSPAADPLGRAGVKGDVNSHFFERFAGSLLQSTLDLGVGLLTRSASDGTVVVGLPGSSTTINSGSDQIQPTLKVKHGAAVSVFVARDLDFSAVL